MSSLHQNIKNTILEFIKDIKDNVLTESTEKGELALVEFFFKKMNSTNVASHVVTHVLPYEIKIKDRDITFFISERKNIFAGLPADRIDYFSNLVTLPETDGGMSTDDKNTVWSYFDSLVELSKNYKKHS